MFSRLQEIHFSLEVSVPFAITIGSSHMAWRWKDTMVDSTANGKVGLSLEIAPRFMLASMTNNSCPA